jgi:hypothetical protein
VQKINYIGIKSRIDPQLHQQMDDDDAAIAKEASVGEDQTMQLSRSIVATCTRTSSLYRVDYNDDLCPASPTNTTYLPQLQAVISPSVSTTASSNHYSSHKESGNIDRIEGEKGHQDPLGFLHEGIEIDVVLDPIIYNKKSRDVDLEPLDETQMTLMPRQAYCHDDDDEPAIDFVMAEAWRMGYEHALSLL